MPLLYEARLDIKSLWFGLLSQIQPIIEVNALVLSGQNAGESFTEHGSVQTPKHNYEHKNENLCLGIKYKHEREIYK